MKPKALQLIEFLKELVQISNQKPSLDILKTQDNCGVQAVDTTALLQKVQQSEQVRKLSPRRQFSRRINRATRKVPDLAKDSFDLNKQPNLQSLPQIGN